MSEFIKVSMLTLNTSHIVYVRELASEYMVVMSSRVADFRRCAPDSPAEFEQVRHDTFHFTKGRPETAALEQWLKAQDKTNGEDADETVAYWLTHPITIDEWEKLTPEQQMKIHRRKR